MSFSFRRISVLLVSLLLICGIANATLRNVQKFSYFNNSGGLNDKLSPITIKDNESSSLKNVDFTLGGAIQKRGGYASDNSTVLGGRLSGLFQYTLSDDTKYLVSVAGGSIYKMDDLDGVFDDISGATTVASTNSALIDFAIANNELVMVDGTNTPSIWDGTGDATVLSGAPKGKYTAFHKNILFIANTVANPSRLQFSNVLDETTWTATDWIDIGADDGEQVTGLQPLLDTLYIFKTNSIWRLSGSDRDSFSLAKMVVGTGCIGGHTIQVIKNRIFFLARDGIYVYDGGINIEEISDRIEGTLDGLNSNVFDLSVSGLFKKNKQYWVAVSSGGISTYRDIILVYDYFHNAWTKYEGIDVMSIASVIDTTGIEQLYTADYFMTAVYLQDSGDNDDGAAIDANYHTKWFRFPEIMQSEKVLRLIRVFAEEAGNWELTIDARSDFASSGTSNTLTLSGSAAVWDTGIWDTSIWGGNTVKVGRFNLSLREEFFKLVFSNANADESFSILGFSMYIEAQDRI